ncbi:transmembrane protein 176A [Perognathus longimembris pacificus]|uniref:transmembrane protein 176A n=1 Tax=Perognathus longimembris pacificus TaxID=214514 RepID=UPI002018C11D|nr:transmembrane protein 176A [Perognathus longimembris pacificus]
MEAAGAGEAEAPAARPTRISVHVHQESNLARLLEAGGSLLRSPSARDGPTPTLGGGQLSEASWVAQIVLGILSGVLGGFLHILWPTSLSRSGAAVWTGAVAVLAGAAAFFYEKRGNFCWALLRTLLWLASFCTAIAAISIAANAVGDYRYLVRDDSCNSYAARVWPTKPPVSPSPEEVERQSLCLSHMDMLKALSLSLYAMLLGVWALLLLASVTPVCLYCWRRFFAEEKKDQKKLLAANGI